MDEKFTVGSIEHSQRHDHSGAPLYAVELASERHRLRMHVANPAIGGVLSPGTEVWFEDPGASEADPVIEVTGAELLAEPAPVAEPAHATPPPLPVASPTPAAEAAPAATSPAPVVTP